MTKVKKRDGREVLFSKQKIEEAVLKAFLAVDGEISEYAESKAQNIADYIEQKFADERLVDIEKVQDLVENGLMSCKRKDVARAYISYRNERNRQRNKTNELLSLAKEKLAATNVQNQNANVDEHSFGGRNGEALSAINKQLALDEYISDMARKNHLNNEIYIHDLDSYVVGSHNCFERNTRFITSLGIKSFEDFSDGDSVTVLGPDGNWYPATVKYYGKQKIKDYLLKKNRTEKVISATSNHRWLLSDGSFQEGLHLNDKLLDSPFYWNGFDFDELSFEGKFYWCFGFIYGDGTLETRYSKAKKEYQKTDKTKVRLCGEKAKYLSRFQEVGYGKNCYAKEPEVTGIPYNKTIPKFENLSLECLVAFIHGYYDADGTKAIAPNTGKQIFSIQATGKESCDFIEQYFAVAGLYINSIVDRTGQETNFGVRGYTKNYQFFAEPSSKFHWYVKDIKEKKNSLQDVWCLEVEEIHAFVLEGGIPTGNCLSIPFDDLLAKGFNTRQCDIRPAASASSAFQLVAVIFQLQSLQMFGGCSATHLDWTMVPYVRKSFAKHYRDGLKYLSDNNEIDYEIEYMLSNATEYSIEDCEYKAYDEKSWNYALDMTKKEIHQSVEALFHNLNTLQSRSGNQLPFSSINYGTCTNAEGRLITKTILEVSIEGVGALHKTAVFPCQIFQCMKGVNRRIGDPNYDLFQLALESTAKRLYPNYCNVDWSGNAGYDKNDPRTYMSTINKPVVI